MPEAVHSQHPKPPQCNPRLMCCERTKESHKMEVNETLFAASVPMKKEADAGVLPAHVENGGDKSGTT